MASEPCPDPGCKNGKIKILHPGVSKTGLNDRQVSVTCQTCGGKGRVPAPDPQRRR
jgi:hypothetical protein